MSQKIYGITVGTPLPKPDWKQNDPKKGDYIKNKPESLGQGEDGITPHIGDNGNWFIGETDTGMPSRGEVGPTGVHVGPDAPEDDAVHVWVDTDEDSNAELPSGGDGGYYTPVITQTEAGKAEFTWTASKDGMPAVASQSVTLPQGPQGEKGEPGADGNDGPKGVPGADGKSAYQYALDGGYTGTEEEFAEKLAAESSAIPVATPKSLGGVKPVAKSADMIQSVGVDENGGLWTKMASAAGSSVSVETLVDLTTTEDTRVIQIPIDTLEMGEKLYSASKMHIVIKVPRDTNDAETNTVGTVTVAFNVGWNENFASAEIIPNPTSGQQNGWVHMVYFQTPASMDTTNPLIVTTTLSGATTILKTARFYPQTIVGTTNKYIRIAGTQNMPAGTRFVLGVSA